MLQDIQYIILFHNHNRRRFKHETVFFFFMSMSEKDINKL